ncbi:MAG TPA: hypothetical protein VMK84_02740 [Streptosporangiaceae bacterium]|nr:hypothetical protein [Streptosporangiaceae bacterium]
MIGPSDPRLFAPADAVILCTSRNHRTAEGGAELTCGLNAAIASGAAAGGDPDMTTARNDDGGDPAAPLDLLLTSAARA